MLVVSGVLPATGCGLFDHILIETRSFCRTILELLYGDEPGCVEAIIASISRVRQILHIGIRSLEAPTEGAQASG
jgi:hypothetical protein